MSNKTLITAFAYSLFIFAIDRFFKRTVSLTETMTLMYIYNVVMFLNGKVKPTEGDGT